MKAPYERNARLIHTVRYVKWMEFTRSAQVVIEWPDGERSIANVSELSRMPKLS